MSALKVSDYLIVSKHRYGKGGNECAIVLGGRLGRLLTVPAAVAGNLVRGKVPEEADLCGVLIEAEILVDAEEDELATMLDAKRRASSDPHAPRGFTIVPNAACNMNCDYCGQTHKGKPLDTSAEAAIVKRVQSAMDAGAPVEIFWFGGEPMIGYASIMRISDGLVTYADRVSAHYRAKLVTNGTLLTLDKLKELARRARVNHVEITLDGPQTIHDLHRPLIGARRNFLHIVDVLSAALQDSELGAVHFRIRTNVDRRNVDSIDEYLETMRDLGMANPNVEFEIHPVYAWSNDVSSIELEREEFARRQIGWMIKMLQLGLAFTAVPTGVKPVVCGAVSKYDEVISSTGRIFSCTEHPLVPRHEENDSLGHVLEALPGRLGGAYLSFYDRIASHEVPCHQCDFLGICGGACPKHWAEGHRPCPDFKDNIQQRLDIAAVINGYRII